jgi:hypothetical protein
MINIHFLLPIVGYHRNLVSPLINARDFFADSGIRIFLFQKADASFGNADITILTSRYFDNKPEFNSSQTIIDFIASFSKVTSKLVFFDTSDSTGTPFFQILPMVDIYLKQFILSDVNLYQRHFYQTRIWADYYHNNFNIDDIEKIECLAPPPDDLHKIKVGWNYSLGRFSPSKIMMKMDEFLLKNNIVNSRPIDRKRYLSSKNNNLSVRISSNYWLKSVAHQRQMLQTHFNNPSISDRVNRKKYWNELRNSKICISPFGWGEICIRDFESILNLCCLFKPDISHLNTFPFIFFPHKTYIPFKWDLSDLDNLIETYLIGWKWRDIATNMYDLYNYYLFNRDGRMEFVEYFKKVVIAD